MASKAGILVFLLSVLNPLTTNALPLNTPLLDEYDYIVVGGGAAGLTVANRLSEDPSTTVLVLEAGPADNGESGVEIPVFMGSEVGTRYDWNLSTVPQNYLDGSPRAIPQGHALGGGTIINGMLWNRGGQGDYADWVALGNPGWSWDDMLPYFMRSETYTPPSAQLDQPYFMEPDMAVHGSGGPVNVSYPNWRYNETIPLYQALQALGVPTAQDVNDGTAGITYLPLDLDPVTQTRSTARRAYYDSVASRPNLYVTTEQTVTRVLFENQPGEEGGASGGENGAGSAAVSSGIFGPPPTATASSRKRNVRSFGGLTSGNSSCNSTDLRAIGVEYAPNGASPRMNVTARREVILSAGSFHSPQILQLSGLGPQHVLSEFGIPVLNNLAGVGFNLQDHYMIDTYTPYNTSEYILPTRLSTDPSWNASAAAEYYANASGPWCLGSPDGDAFPSLPSIVNGNTSIADAAASQAANQYLAPGLDSTLVAGFAAQQALLVNALRDEGRAVYELLNNNAGTMTLSNMRPFSRGSVQISSTDPFSPPAIDPRYGSNPVDMQVLLATLHFNERILAQPAMASLNPVQNVPPPGASDDSLMQTLKSSLRTEYHPSGTCAMMPRELGGVVDPNLLVYGTANLRVVDASIFPVVPAAHLQAVVYGVAEKAADIIRSSPSQPGSCGLAPNATSGNFTTRAPSSALPTRLPASPSSISSRASGAVSAGFGSSAKRSSSDTASLSSLVSSALVSAHSAPTSSAVGGNGVGGVPVGGSLPSAGSASITIPAVPPVVTVTKYLAPGAPSGEESSAESTEVPTGASSANPASTQEPCKPEDRWDQAWVVAKARSDFRKLFGFVDPYFVAGN